MQARQFPKYYDFLDSLGTTYKALDVRKDLEERIVKGLEAAKRVYNKWNNTHGSANSDMNKGGAKSRYTISGAARLLSQGCETP